MTASPGAVFVPAADAAGLPVFNTLWIGERVGPLPVLCMLSAVRQGHHVRLFGYQRFPEVPGEIEQADARMVVPEDQIFVHRATGSPSPFSNRFRFELVAAGYGAWMDTDQLILRPVRAKGGFLAGWDNPANKVGTTVVLYPPGGPLAEELLCWTRRRDYVPPWLPWAERARLTARRWAGLGSDRSTHPWGTSGPRLFTHMLRKHGLTGLVSPETRFCPVPYAEKERPFRADGETESFFADGTEGLHLWHQGLRGGTDGRNGLDRREWAFEEGSFLWRMACELDLPQTVAWRL